MTAADLIERLRAVPADMPVYVSSTISGFVVPSVDVHHIEAWNRASYEGQPTPGTYVLVLWDIALPGSSGDVGELVARLRNRPV